MPSKTQAKPEITVLEGFTPGAEIAEAAATELVRLSKYGRIATDRASELPPYSRIDENQDIVAVFEKATGLVGVVHRHLVGSKVVGTNDDGSDKVQRDYELVGFKRTPSPADALAIVWAPRQSAAAETLGALMEAPF